MKYRVRLTEKGEADVAGVLEWFCDQQALAAGGNVTDRLGFTRRRDHATRDLTKPIREQLPCHCERKSFNRL